MKMSLSKTESEATLTSQTSPSSLTNIASLPTTSLPTSSLSQSTASLSTPNLSTFNLPLKRTLSTKSIGDSIQRSINRLSSRFANRRNCPETAAGNPFLDPLPPPPNELTQPKASQEVSKSLLKHYKNDLDEEYGHRGSSAIFNFQYFENNADRAGSEHDVANLTVLFKRLGLKVFPVYESLTKKEFLKSLKAFAKYEGHKKGNMIFVSILSHGDNNVIETSDGKLVNLDVEVYPLFYNDACPDLINKPKNFVIQSCRGDNTQQGIFHDFKSSANGVKANRNVADISIVYSTIPLHVSYRIAATGSWLISSYCDVIGEFGNDYKYNELLMLVSQEVDKKTSLQGKKMTPEINYRGFDRYFQLKLLTPEEVHEKEEREKEKKSWGRRLRSSLRSLPSFFERK